MNKRKGMVLLFNVFNYSFAPILLSMGLVENLATSDRMLQSAT